MPESEVWPEAARNKRLPGAALLAYNSRRTMRALLIFAAIVALPVFVLAHRQHFLNTLQPRLIRHVLAALDDPAFEGVKKDSLGPNYLDVTLEGSVADPALRDEARKRVSAIRGVRCREEDNHLYVPARLTGHLDGDKLTLAGWLHDESALQDVTRWLGEARPGLKVDATELHISPHVSRMDSPLKEGGGALPQPLVEIWNALRVSAGLRVARRGDTIMIEGTLPAQTLRDAVMGALTEAKTAAKIDDVKLKAGPFVRVAQFADETALPELLKSFFESPDAESFVADGETVKLKGVATPDQERKWRELVGPLADRTAIAMDVPVFAAPILFPSYKPQSLLPSDAMQQLRTVLQASVIHYPSGELGVVNEELPKFNAAAQAIVAAGPTVRIVLGAHLDSMDDPALNEGAAKKRLEIVSSLLQARGIAAQQIETMILPPCPAPDGSDQGRNVEFVIK